MIVVKVELHSAITGKVSHLGSLIIANDGTGTKSRGNYDAQLVRKDFGKGRRVRVEDHPRLSQSVWCLILKALGKLYGGPVSTMAPDGAQEEAEFIPGKSS